MLLYQAEYNYMNKYIGHEMMKNTENTDNWLNNNMEAETCLKRSCKQSAIDLIFIWSSK
jgi:hypothetical protein